jgi:hypothetical protein
MLSHARSPLGTFDSEERDSFFAAVSPAVTHATSPGSELPHERLRKKIFGSTWTQPSLKDTEWLFSAFSESDSAHLGTLDNAALRKALRTLPQLASLRDEVSVRR